MNLLIIKMKYELFVRNKIPLTYSSAIHKAWLQTSTSRGNGIYMVRLQDAEGNNIGQGKFVINK
ncbi:MAG: hypothetical protein RI955_599 [Bacteroidota bacterium]